MWNNVKNEKKEKKKSSKNWKIRLITLRLKKFERDCPKTLEDKKDHLILKSNHQIPKKMIPLPGDPPYFSKYQLRWTGLIGFYSFFP